MADIEAIYQNGVFQPLGPVGLHENQRVRLSVRPVEGGDPRGWLEEVQRLQRRIVAERGFFPDSSLDIAADRLR